MNTPEATPTTERDWLSEGIQRGVIRQEVATAIMRTLNNYHAGEADEYNDLSVYETQYSKLPHSDQFPTF